ncbi:hypothetical protein F8M41_019103 [Gigaspora margarita]|uniref:Uncharacterized protein n=1 Tax=Gigaspora margarita TaxID=4874 RepID=A0A8H4EKT2_GIGMA|nr:hypothetical protein F8M41_019103 [Gigaspora margarita]
MTLKTNSLKGSIDYISAGKGELDNCMALLTRQSTPSNRVFCGTVTKKDELFAQSANILIGQMKALHIREKYDLKVPMFFYSIYVI